MSRFSELTQNKNIIINTFIQSDNLVKALVFNDKDFLSKSLSEVDRSSLPYSYIFPYRHVPDMQSDAKTLLTMDFEYKPHCNNFKMSSIFFYVLTHQSLVSTSYGLRTDFMVSTIDELFNQSRLVGIGRLPFYMLEDFVVDQGGQWVGSKLAYRTFEFN